MFKVLCYNTSMNGIVLQENLLDLTIKRLWQAGMDVHRIAKALDVQVPIIRKHIPSDADSDYPDIGLNQQLVNEILYDANAPLAKDAIVAIEKTRYQHYAQLEETCLRIMNNLLLHYEKVPIGDDKIDRFKAQMAANFIKATQSAREEVLKKYEIDKTTGQKQDSITVEIVNPKKDM